MYLRKETRLVKTGSVQLVPYCDDCNSQDIKTIQICNKCGSQNIKVNDLFDTDERGIKYEVAEKDFYIYKCDNCGKEFEGLKESERIAFVANSFDIGNYSDAFRTVNLSQTLCNDCKKILKDILNKSFNNLLDDDYILNLIQNDLPKETAENKSETKVGDVNEVSNGDD